jgi:hypothetical protein
MQQSFKANPRYVREARALIGRRAWLRGGGQCANSVILVTVKAVRKGHAIVDAGDVFGGREFTPYLWSWYVQEIHSHIEAQLADVPNGEYYFSFPNKSGLARLYKQGLLSIAAHWSKQIDCNCKIPKEVGQ